MIFQNILYLSPEIDFFVAGAARLFLIALLGVSAKKGFVVARGLERWGLFLGRLMVLFAIFHGSPLDCLCLLFTES